MEVNKVMEHTKLNIYCQQMKNSEIQCIECGSDCHCSENLEQETSCPHCNCVNIAMERDGSA